MYFFLIVGIFATVLYVSFEQRVNEINSKRESFINMMETAYGKEVAECFQWSQEDTFLELFKGDFLDSMSKNQSLELAGFVSRYEELGKELEWNKTAKDWSSYVGIASLIYAFALFVSS